MYLGDMIRVLNQKSASRHLLKGHTAPVSDLQFFSSTTDLLASGGKDGNVYIWKIIEMADASLR